MRYLIIAAAAVAAGAIGSIGLATADPMPMDSPVNMNGVETVCTGIGSAEDNPEWKAYPIRVEFSNGGAQYLAGAHVTLDQGGKTLADFDCSGSWVLFRLGSGTYKVTATLHDQANAGPHSATFSPPSQGQKRVIIRFPKPANQ